MDRVNPAAVRIKYASPDELTPVKPVRDKEVSGVLCPRDIIVIRDAYTDS